MILSWDDENFTTQIKERFLFCYWLYIIQLNQQIWPLIGIDNLKFNCSQLLIISTVENCNFTITLYFPNNFLLYIVFFKLSQLRFENPSISFYN